MAVKGGKATRGYEDHRRFDPRAELAKRGIGAKPRPRTDDGPARTPNRRGLWLVADFEGNPWRHFVLWRVEVRGIAIELIRSEACWPDVEDCAEIVARDCDEPIDWPDVLLQTDIPKGLPIEERDRRARGWAREMMEGAIDGLGLSAHERLEVLAALTDPEATAL